MTISERIFERLRQLDMTQKEFAEETGIKQSTISEWKKNGSLTEFISRRKESKTLAWSSIMLAFDSALQHRGEVIERPKALGAIIH